MLVHEKVLFNGQPVVGIDQFQHFLPAILVLHAYATVYQMALHMIGRACHQQINMLCMTFQKDLCALRIIVPLRNKQHIGCHTIPATEKASPIGVSKTPSFTAERRPLSSISALSFG